MRSGKYENSDLIFIKEEDRGNQSTSRKRRNFILGSQESSEGDPADFFDQ